MPSVASTISQQLRQRLHARERCRHIDWEGIKQELALVCRSSKSGSLAQSAWCPMEKRKKRCFNSSNCAHCPCAWQSGIDSLSLIMQAGKELLQISMVTGGSTVPLVDTGSHLLSSCLHRTQPFYICLQVGGEVTCLGHHDHSASRSSRRPEATLRGRLDTAPGRRRCCAKARRPASLW